MNRASADEFDLTISRIIKAPRRVVWNAWTNPANLQQWWVPAPARCRVHKLNLMPGGAFVTHISEGSGDFTPHMNCCFLAVDDGERLVFTNALVDGWRPADASFLVMTAIITLRDHPRGTEYSAHVMHRNQADRDRHEELGFYNGWGTCLDQLTTLAEQLA